mmetsp:Transcript_51329/g.145338  ORF Transcript_51329/g.145338 Transcript_51329/m.145338 type:complete len:203 (+) Transcript_51329:94-702(+)
MKVTTSCEGIRWASSPLSFPRWSTTLCNGRRSCGRGGSYKGLPSLCVHCVPWRGALGAVQVEEIRHIGGPSLAAAEPVPDQHEQQPELVASFAVTAVCPIVIGPRRRIVRQNEGVARSDQGRCWHLEGELRLQHRQHRAPSRATAAEGSVRVAGQPMCLLQCAGAGQAREAGGQRPELQRVECSFGVAESLRSSPFARSFDL